MKIIKWAVKVEPLSSRDVLGWRELPSLHEVYPHGGQRLTDKDCEGEEYQALALRLLFDTRKVVWRPRSEFMSSMLETADATRLLTDRQVRGVLNVIGGSIRGNRRRFWKSRPYRRDRNNGCDVCLVCGGPLDTWPATARGLGDVCYRRVLEGL